MSPRATLASRIGRRSVVSIVVAAIAVALGAAFAFAYWTTTGTGAASATTGTLNRPAVQQPSATGGSVRVSWTAPITGVAPAGYYVTRTNTSTSTTVAACGLDSSHTTTLLSCNDTGVPSGTYTYAVTAVYHSWTATGTSPSVTVSAATKLAFTSPAVSGSASASANLGPITVQLQDANGGAATNNAATVVNLTSNSRGAVFATSANGSSVTSVTIPSGTTNTTFYYGDTKAGTPTITVAALSLTNATQQETITAGAASTVSADSGTPQATRVGTAFGDALGAKVLDAYGNSVPGVTVTFTAPSNGASGKFTGTNAISTTAVTGASGVATSGTFTANTVAGSYSVNATFAGGTNTATFSLTNTAGAAKNLNANPNTTPQSATVGNAFTTPLSVTVVDANNNPVSGVTVTFTAPGSGASGTFSDSHTPTTTATTNSSGIATATAFTANTVAASYTVIASAPAANSANFALTNNPGSATNLVFGQQPTRARAGVAIAPPITVQVQDANGNVVTSNTASITMAIGTNPGSGTLSGTKTINAVNGAATFSDLAINRAATGYTLTASATSLSGATSAAFNITSGDPSKLVFVSAAFSGSATSTANLGPISVQIQDSSGNPATSATATTVGLSSNSAGAAAFAATSAGTAVTSVSIPAGSSSASFYYGDTRRGTPTITVSSSGLTSATQQETINAGSAAQIQWTTQPANTTKGTLFPIAVKVVDQFGNAVPNVTVSFTLNNPGSVQGANFQQASPSGVTDSTTGVASTSVSVNKAGTFSINASFSGITATSATFIEN